MDYSTLFICHFQYIRFVQQVIQMKQQNVCPRTLERHIEEFDDLKVAILSLGRHALQTKNKVCCCSEMLLFSLRGQFVTFLYSWLEYLSCFYIIYPDIMLWFIQVFLAPVNNKSVNISKKLSIYIFAFLASKAQGSIQTIKYSSLFSDSLGLLVAPDQCVFGSELLGIVCYTCFLVMF